MRYYFFIITFLAFGNFSYAVPHTLTDGAIVEHAEKKIFNAVFQLKRRVLPLGAYNHLKTARAGSCVHIGDGIFITAAHCVKNVIFASGPVIEGSDGCDHVVTHIEKHPNYKPKEKNAHLYDLAVLLAPTASRLPTAAANFSEVITCGQTLTAAGFGMSSGPFFSRCDGKKRACDFKVNAFRSYNDSSLCNISTQYKDTIDYGLPVRPGHSGGGVFTKSGKFVAIFVASKRTLRRPVYSYFKLLAALGIPVPLMVPRISHSTFAPLSNVKKFIEGKKEAFKKTASSKETAKLIQQSLMQKAAVWTVHPIIRRWNTWINWLEETIE